MVADTAKPIVCISVPLRAVTLFGVTVRPLKYADAGWTVEDMDRAINKRIVVRKSGRVVVSLLNAPMFTLSLTPPCLATS
jgi:hypothetical protein